MMVSKPVNTEESTGPFEQKILKDTDHASTNRRTKRSPDASQKVNKTNDSQSYRMKVCEFMSIT